MDGWIAWLRHDWPLIAALAVCFLAGVLAERALRRSRRRWPRRPRAAQAGVDPLAFDAATQLRIVERSSFTPKPLLNRGESRLLRVLDEACAAEAPTWRVMAQVSMGEILASTNPDAYRAINSKRVDFLLVDTDCRARVAIEFQGSGHHAGRPRRAMRSRRRRCDAREWAMPRCCPAIRPPTCARRSPGS